MGQRKAARATRNKLQLGLFGANCSSGRTYATLPERWEASWENNLQLAQMADAIGIECIRPIVIDDDERHRTLARHSQPHEIIEANATMMTREQNAIDTPHADARNAQQ